MIVEQPEQSFVFSVTLRGPPPPLIGPTLGCKTYIHIVLAPEGHPTKNFDVFLALYSGKPEITWKIEVKF